MKRLFSFVLCFTLLFTLSACGGDTKDKEHTFTKAELAEYSEYYELTTENWTDFIEVIEKEVVEKDSFGEEIGRSTETYLRLKDNCYISENNAIKLTFTRDNGARLIEETKDFVFYNTVSREIFILFESEYGLNCEKVKGTILILNVPEDKWLLDEDGNKYLNTEHTRIYDDSVTYDYFIE